MSESEPSLVFVVTISEQRSDGTHETGVEVFGREDAAVEWIEATISALVEKHRLDAASAVDGWFVKLDGWGHTIQFDVVEKALR